MEIDYAERVARGARLLDEKWPNWRQEADANRVNIASSYDCMTAQFAQWVTGDEEATFNDGQSRLGLDDTTYAQHGFNANPDEADSDDTQEAHYNHGIATLNALWRDLIVQHQYAPAPRQEGDAA